MNLEVNASRSRAREHGYAMAALLVAMGVMAVLMTVALPTWKQTVRREKEEELVFRGTQYARAIGAYQRKYANASPASIDVLVEQHFLRKKYTDPLAPTKDGEFAPLYVSNRGTGAQAGQAGTSSAGTMASTTPSGGGIIGVASKNTGESLRIYNDHNHYNEWQFIALQESTRAGGAGQGGPGAGPGGPGAGQSGGRQGRSGAGPGGPGGGAPAPRRGVQSQGR